MNFKKVLATVTTCIMLSTIMASSIMAAENIKTEPKTRITITDEKTGEKMSYTLDAHSMTTMSAGKEMTTVSFEIGGNPNPTPYATQTVEDVLEGYSGMVKITYSDDGTFACLEKINANWYGTGSSSDFQDASLNYGQALGTNSYSKRNEMSGVGIQFNTGFKPGKYGYNLDHFLGATLNGKISGNWVSIECNVNF